MSTTTRKRSTARSRTAIAALAAAVTCIGLLALPGGASASKVQCQGRLIFDKEVAPATNLAYQFHCDTAFAGYSLFTDRTFNYFSPEVVEPLTPVLFGCEGPIPTRGFSCNPPSKSGQPSYGSVDSFPTAAPGAQVVGAIGVDKNPCKKLSSGKRQKFWFTVVTFEKDNNNRWVLANSEPFPLGSPQCKKAKKHSGRHHAS